jgi:hypothetical protein
MPFATSCSISIDNAGKGAASTGAGTSGEAMALGAVTLFGPRQSRVPSNHHGLAATMCSI